MRGIITSVETRSKRAALRELEAVLAVDRDGDDVAGVDEQAAQRLAHDVGVLDQQDLRARAARRRRAPRRARGATCAGRRERARDDRRHVEDQRAAVAEQRGAGDARHAR